MACVLGTRLKGVGSNSGWVFLLSLRALSLTLTSLLSLPRVKMGNGNCWGNFWISARGRVVASALYSTSCCVIRLGTLLWYCFPPPPSPSTKSISVTVSGISIMDQNNFQEWGDSSLKHLKLVWLKPGGPNYTKCHLKFTRLAARSCIFPVNWSFLLSFFHWNSKTIIS